jgi:hypothetical protein
MLYFAGFVIVALIAADLRDLPKRRTNERRLA